MKIKHLFTAAAVAATSFFGAPAMASVDQCYNTTGGSKICHRWLADGEYAVAIVDPEYLWPEAMHLTCWDDGTNEYKSYGGLSQVDKDAVASAICADL